MQKEDMSILFDVANAEQAGRNLAAIITDFRDEIKKEINHGFERENVNELTMFFGKALIAKTFLTQTDITEELEE